MFSQFNKIIANSGKHIYVQYEQFQKSIHAYTYLYVLNGTVHTPTQRPIIAPIGQAEMLRSNNPSASVDLLDMREI